MKRWLVLSVLFALCGVVSQPCRGAGLIIIDDPPWGAGADPPPPAALAAPAISIPAAPAHLRAPGGQSRQRPYPHQRPTRGYLRGPGVLQPQSVAAGRNIRLSRSQGGAPGQVHDGD